MTKYVKIENGQIYGYPDDASEDEINSSLPTYNPTQDVPNQLNAIYSGHNYIPDIGRDLLYSGFKGLSWLGNAGQKIASTLTGGYAPTVNYNDDPFKPIESPTKYTGKGLVEGFGSYAPYAAAGGASLLGQIGAGGLYGYENSPENSSLSNKILTSLQDAALGSLGAAGHEALPVISNKFPAIVNPIKNLFSTSLNNLTGNIIKPNNPNISNINYATSPNLQTNVIYDSINSPKNMYNPSVSFGALPSSMVKKPFNAPDELALLPKPQLSTNDLISSFINKTQDGRTLQDSSNLLNNNLINYYKTNKEELQNGYNDFYKQPTNQPKIGNIQGVGNVVTKENANLGELPVKDSNYLSNFNNIKIPNSNIQKLHSAFINDNNINNGSELLKELGSERYYLTRQLHKGNLDNDGKELLSSYSNMHDNLKNDLQNNIKNINPNYLDKFNQLNTDWRYKIGPFNSDQNLKDIVTEKLKNPKQSTMRSIFESPEPELTSVIDELPHGSKDYLSHIMIGRNMDDFNANDILSAKNKFDTLNMQGLLPETYSNLGDIRLSKLHEDTIDSENKKRQAILDELQKQHESEQNLSYKQYVNNFNRNQKEIINANKNSDKLVSELLKKQEEDRLAIENKKQERRDRLKSYGYTALTAGAGAAISPFVSSPLANYIGNILGHHIEGKYKH